MLRQNRRWMVRAGFIAVLAMGLFGFSLVVSIWVPLFEQFEFSTFANGADWVDLVAGASEQAAQLLLGVTSGQ